MKKSTIGPVMLDVASTQLCAEDKEKLLHPACGGVILFSRNIESPRQVMELNHHIRKLNPALLIAVDQEGGRVQRLKTPFSILPALKKLSEAVQEEEEMLRLAFHHGRLMALEVLSVGFDLSFAPILDISWHKSRVIADRGFHEDPVHIIRLAKGYIAGMNEVGMSATGKHFPGHGRLEEDSHTELPIDKRVLSEIREDDMTPFTALANELGGMMPAHIIFSQVDDAAVGFSKVWLQNILREEIGFKGAIFSDDLSMKGAEAAGDFTQRAGTALEAGCDMVLVCNQPEEAGRVLTFCETIDFPEVCRQRLSAMKAETSIKMLGLEDMQSHNPAWQESRHILDSYFEL